ncbi:nicotinate phosphoribosyltransferase [Eremomyces bilateralis CBS 781.70]|uniref:nicotinate phosphoribosyltransferase n=1 Tax=Eremomyces bilateralis CBS 781.70 TaxID=1392243 RepID=A0A6G1FX70_9PEZI|nr:nicotinate phosphoribosyltransferase [Eremomyces bilateralis CBS 781.70]KAF1810383.1 nicotinate phosphoribosyltransferase [Eremomyces bilateralis CBS 781.70]
MAGQNQQDVPEGVFSILDTDLYKLTMQACILRYFPDIEATYHLTNRTPNMKLSRTAVQWLQKQIDRLANIRLTPDEFQFLGATCPYLNQAYLAYLEQFQFKPSEQVSLKFHAESSEGDEELGGIELKISGRWIETILYEIPLLALVSEAYFKFRDRDWNYDGQVEKAKEKGTQLLKAGCRFSEFGSRRRRNYHAQKLVLQGMIEAKNDGENNGWPGQLTGTSNVHFAMSMGLQPVGTVAHEWFMGIAAATNDYENANEIGLRCWINTFGEGVLAVMLTDTFGTPAFLKAFRKKIRPADMFDHRLAGLPQRRGSMTDAQASELHGLYERIEQSTAGTEKTFAQAYTGVRQDSGDPLEFIQSMRKFYDQEGITDQKSIVFSDSLTTDLCLKYKAAAEASGFQPSFGVGTFFTNDFVSTTTGHKSTPMNIVIKISSASGNPAIKISDNIGKNTGDSETVKEVKRRLGYVEHEWVGGDESARWGK